MRRRSSSTCTKPAASPFGDTSHRPSASAVAINKNGECRFHNLPKFFDGGYDVLERAHVVSLNLNIPDVEQPGRVAAQDGSALRQ